MTCCPKHELTRFILSGAWEGGDIRITLFYEGARLREIQAGTRVHTAREQWGWDLNPGGLRAGPACWSTAPDVCDLARVGAS